MKPFTFDTISEIKGQLYGWPAASIPLRERGGLLLGDDEAVRAAVPIANWAENPTAEFKPNTEEVAAKIAAVEGTGAKLLGTYHSHPNGKAMMSRSDVVLAEATGLLLIVATPDPDLSLWDWALFDPRGGGQVELRIAPPFTDI